MFVSTTYQSMDQGTAEERLWRAVIARTLEEWVRGPLSFSRRAEQFLFNDNRDFDAVCSSAGMDPGYLRSRLQRIRDRMHERKFHA
jgi:hypothetical protein